MVYFQIGKTTPVNYISIKKMASFRAADAALAAPTFIDHVKPGFPFGQPFPVYQQFRRGTLNVSSTKITKYEPGMLMIPDHEVQTGKWLYYMLGACTTVGVTAEVSTITCIANVADSLHETCFYLEVIENSDSGDVVKYCIWFNTDGGADPTPAGYTGCEVILTANDTAAEVATALANAVNAKANLTDDTTAVAADTVVTCTNTYKGAVDDVYDSAVPTGFTFAVTTQGVSTHTITEATTLPFLGIHCEMEHTTAGDSERVDLLGDSIQDFKDSWSQDNPTMQSLGIIVAKDVAGSDITRPTRGDYLGFFKAGYTTVTFEYNSADAGCTVWGGSISVRNYLEYRKVADVYATESLFNKREYTINLDLSLSDDILLDIADDPESYAGAITLVVKHSRSATDYIQFTLSSLQLDPNSVRGKKIDEDEFFWRGTITLRNCGAIASILQAAGTLAIEVKDELSNEHYEV